MVVWLKRIGCAVAIVIGVVFLWRGLLSVVAAIAGIAVVAYVGNEWRKLHAVQRFRAAWKKQGRDLLLVYSNSPHWKQYVEENWVPRWGHRAVLLNWSERSEWKRPSSAEVALFRAFGGVREFNPLAIVVPPTGRKVQIVRFWQAFRERKHGKERLLLAAEAELESRLATVSALTRGVL